MEVETHFQIAIRLTYLERGQAKPAWDLLQETGRLLNGLMRSLTDDSQGIREQSEIYQVSDPWPQEMQSDP